jgi:hypothetical protein
MQVWFYSYCTSSDSLKCTKGLTKIVSAVVDIIKDGRLFGHPSRAAAPRDKVRSGQTYQDGMMLFAVAIRNTAWKKRLDIFRPIQIAPRPRMLVCHLHAFIIIGALRGRYSLLCIASEVGYKISGLKVVLFECISI